MRPLLLLVLGFCLVPTVGNAQSLRCDRRLVGVGDTSHELRTRCGRPDDRSSQTRIFAEGVILPRGFRIPPVTRTPTPTQRDIRRAYRRGGYGRGPVQAAVRYTREKVEAWTYAGRHGDLGRVAIVRRGKIVAIETLGKLALTPRPGCTGLSSGARVGTVKLRCGAPVDRAEWTEERVLIDGRGLEVRQLINHTTWTYDPGPGSLLRILHFENGKLVRTETGGRSPS